MIIVGFSNKTSKLLPRLFCKKFKHVAPIVIGNSQITMYQFVRRGEIAKINIGMRDIKILEKHGWKFICVPRTAQVGKNADRAFTCVDMSKRIIGIKNLWVQTPWQLYKKVNAI